MFTDRRAGVITISLEDCDFRDFDWRSFIAELKTIKGWEYSGEPEKIWTFPDTEQNVERINEIIDKYTKNENQLELF